MRSPTLMTAAVRLSLVMIAVAVALSVYVGLGGRRASENGPLAAAAAPSHKRIVLPD